MTYFTYRRVDAFNNTYVLNIKPYLPYVGFVKSIQNELIKEELGHNNEIFINNSTFFNN